MKDSYSLSGLAPAAGMMHCYDNNNDTPIIRTTTCSLTGMIFPPTSHIAMATSTFLGAVLFPFSN